MSCAKVVEGWDPTAAPDFFEVLRQHVPKDAFRESRTKVVIHGQKQRNESSYELAGVGRRGQITVSNGHENVRYDPVNGQASLMPAIVGTTPHALGPTPSEFYALPSIAYVWGNRAGLPKPQVTREAGKLILERQPPGCVTRGS